jgi:methionyl-tRNA formyltransferase
MAGKIKIVLFGSLGVACDCLEWLLEQEEFDVMGVVCSRTPKKAWRVAVQDRDMQEVAPKLGVRLLDIDEVCGLNADLGLSVRFHQILRRRHLDSFKQGVVNLHGAILPEMRGAVCDSAAIIEGRTEFGSSLHWMDEGIDSGDFLADIRFPIVPQYTVYDVFRLCNELGLQLIKMKLLDIVAGKIVGISQEQLCKQRGIEPKVYRTVDVLSMKCVPETATTEEMWVFAKAFHFPGQEPPYIDSKFGKLYLQVDPLQAAA